MQEKFLTTGETAKHFGFSRARFAYLIESGTLPGPSQSVPGRWLFSRDDLEHIAIALNEHPEIANLEGGQQP